jgi:V/A-type H+-transporting ATPase subunit I
MIVKMKSIAVLGLESHTDTILNELRNIGVVHVRHVKAPEGRSLETLSDEIGQASAVLNLLPEWKERSSSTDEGKSLIGKVFALGERRRILEEELNQLRREAARVSFLGSFRPEDIEQLAGQDVKLRLFECPLKEESKIPSDLIHIKVGERDKKSVFAAVSYQEHGELPFDEVPIPPRSVSQVEGTIQEKEAELAKVESEIEGFAPLRGQVEKTLVEWENAREFERVRAGKGEDEQVIFIRGYCPVPDLERLGYAAEKNAWGLVVSEPEDGEEPPTLLKKPGWIRIVDPVFDFIKTVPGYREFDISLWFLLFFSVFFAMLIGDAGYGLIFLGLTVFAHLKLGKKVKLKQPFYLMYVLSLCTIAYGAMTGNWLGVEAIGRASPFKYLMVPALDAFSSVSQQTVMLICFYIGAIQLTIGHLIVAYRYINSLKAVEQIGWVLVLWAAFFLARLLVLSHPLPSFFMALGGSGVLLVLLSILLDRLKRKNLFMSVYDLVFSCINAFADSMSYIRLFAVGMATLAVAQSFNEMAVGTVGFANVFTGFAAALILFLGHTLNIVLALMAVVVHGVRLNMLEFSGHVGNTWSGYDYSPFEKKAVD